LRTQPLSLSALRFIISGERYTIRPMKMVWVLGAGASAAAGYPLVADFLQHTYLQHLDTLFGVQGWHYFATNLFADEVRHFVRKHSDLNRLMADCLQRGDIEELRRLNNLVAGIIDLLRTLHTGCPQQAHLRSFAHYLASSNSSVISFNYDTLIEEQLGSIYRQANTENVLTSTPPYRYGFPEGLYANACAHDALYALGSGDLLTRIQQHGTVLLLKLHGSMEWSHCAKCNLVVYAPPPNSLFTRYLSKVVTAGDYSCPRCGEYQRFSMLFVPPANDRHFLTTEFLDHLWDAAEGELLSADIIIVAGYSLPPEDRRAMALLIRAAKRNAQAKLLVVDPYLTAGLQERFQAVSQHCMFYRGTFYRLIADLCCAWSGFEPPASVISPWLAEMVREDSQRSECFFGSIPLGMSLASDLMRDNTSSETVCEMPTIIGTSGTDDAADFLSAAAVLKTSALVRARCVEALGSVGTQEALELLLSFTLDLSLIQDPYVRELPDYKVEIALYAANGIEQSMMIFRQLDYSRAHVALMLLLDNKDASWFLLIEAGRALRFGYASGLISDPRWVKWVRGVVQAFGRFLPKLGG